MAMKAARVGDELLELRASVPRVAVLAVEPLGEAAGVVSQLLDHLQEPGLAGGPGPGGGGRRPVGRGTVGAVPGAQPGSGGAVGGVRGGMLRRLLRDSGIYGVSRLMVRGLSLFLVPKFLAEADGTLGARNDVKAIGLEEKLGIHGSPTCTIRFGDEGGATGYLIGEENKGLACMFTMMNNARLHVGMQGVAIAERATQHAIAYARERRQGARPGGEEGGAVAVDFPLCPAEYLR